MVLIVGAIVRRTERTHPQPLQIFILYPNYRGTIFSDQSQVARVAVEVHPPADAPVAKLDVALELTGADERALLTNLVSAPAAGGSAVATMDMSSVPPGQYRLRGYLEGPGGHRIFASLFYPIVKIGSQARASMKAWIDPDNVIHMGGRPRFVIGLYDTTGYSLHPDYYAPRLKEIARAPINLMINYLLSDGRAEVIYPYTEAMKPLGIFYLATVNALFGSREYPPRANSEHLDADALIAQYSKSLAGDSRVVGYYTCDECASEAVPRTFHQYGLIKQNDPASVTFAVENYPDEFRLWRDSVDVLGVDPYVFGARHRESYVADMTRAAIAAVHGARPVWTVIQFFQLSPLSHFPTEQELHDMSWMAIAEGARGVIYWSYGLRGLDWGRPDPVLRQKRYEELVNVTREISALEPALIAPDSPVLSANSAADTVITKEKDIQGGSRYLISYNHNSKSVDTSFTLRRPAHAVSVVGENRSISVDRSGSRFKDIYAPFQAHVYKID